MKTGAPLRSWNAAGSAASTGSTSKKRPKTAFIASSEAAVPVPWLRNWRRLTPSRGAIRAASARIRSSTRRCAAVCGIGGNSSFDTSRVGIGTALRRPRRMPGVMRKLMPASSQALLRALGLDALAQGQPEAVAAPGTLLHVRLRLGLLLSRESLRVRETNAPAAFLDRQHQHLDLAVHGEGLAGVRAAAHRELRGGHQTRLARAEAHEDAERFVALHFPGEQ